MKVTIAGRSLELAKGDITDLDVDAIVNAANDRLVLGAGVAGAIARKGGPSIQRECDAIGGTPVGTAAITGGGSLKAGHVIHAVGPRMGEGDEDAKLASATHSALDLADSRGLGSVAFPAISTGVFGFPLDRCAEIMLGAVLAAFRARRGPKNVVFCLFDAAAFAVFRETLVRLSKE